MSSSWEAMKKSLIALNLYAFFYFHNDLMLSYFVFSIDPYDACPSHCISILRS
jgi:hypothetical protein